MRGSNLFSLIAAALMAGNAANTMPNTQSRYRPQMFHRGGRTSGKPNEPQYPSKLARNLDRHGSLYGRVSIVSQAFLEMQKQGKLKKQKLHGRTA